MSFADEAHLLLVEEDAQFRALLSRYLSRQGFWVTGARSHAHGMRLTDGLAFDMILVTAEADQAESVSMLISRVGCQAIGVAASDAAVPVLQRAGAVETVTKPFAPEALLDRINARLDRRPVRGLPPPRRLRLGPLTYDVDRGELWRGDESVRLTATESLLMRLFAARPGEALDRSRLVTDLGRAGGQAQERAIDVQITRLRRKLETDPKSPRYLQTVRGAGYLLQPD